MSKKKSKSRSFSIYLLKPAYTATNTLIDDHGLEAVTTATNLPTGSLLYVLDTPPRAPWWKGYFGITKDLSQASKGALVFLPVKDRWFALSFGHVYHHMKDTAYEYDFGLRVTLNTLDPDRLISSDTVEPSAARRQRTQMPKEADLTYFDFDRDSNIIKSLTGKVRNEYKDLVRHVTGSSNLRISSDMQPDALISTCEKLLEIYGKDDYKTSFPNLQNIVPTKDPATIAQLDGKVLEAFRVKNIELCLTVPDIVNYADNVYSQFSGGRSGVRYEDVDMQNYYDHLQTSSIDYNTVDIDTLKKHKLVLVDEDGTPQGSHTYNIYRSLIFDVELNGDTYHLCDGNWYKIESDYMVKLQTFLDPCYEDLANLPAYTHDTETAYNTDVAKDDNSFLCLDRKNFAPTGQTAIEPCDLYTVSNGTGILCHVKVSTRSAQLSHLFAQGQNSIEIMKSEAETRDKMKALIKDRLNGQDEATYLAPIDNGPYKVVYAIISKRNKTGKSKNLPLFSRISLMRSIKALNLMGVTTVYCFVEDQVAKKAAQPKPKKKRKAKAQKAQAQTQPYNFPANINAPLSSPAIASENVTGDVMQAAGE